LRRLDDANKSSNGGARRDARSNESPSRRPNDANNKSGRRVAGRDALLNKMRDQTILLRAARMTRTRAATGGAL